MSNPPYTFVVDRPSTMVGDTLEASGFRLTREDDTPIIPDSVCATLADSFGRTVYTFNTDIDPVTGRVFLDSINPQDLPRIRAGVHSYAVQYIFADGSKKTYFRGNIDFQKGAPECR